MTIRYTLLLLSFAFFVSCDKDDDSGPEKLVDTAKLKGEWECKSLHTLTYDGSGQRLEEKSVYNAAGPVLFFSGSGVVEEGSNSGGKFYADATGTYQLNSNTLNLNITQYKII